MEIEIEKKFKLVNLKKDEREICVFLGVIIVLGFLLKDDINIILSGTIVVIALVGFFSIKNTYFDSKIESWLNLILLALVEGEKLSSKALIERVSDIVAKNNKSNLVVFFIACNYYKILNRLLYLGYIDVEIDWSENQFTDFYKITNKGLALAKRQESIS